MFWSYIAGVVLFGMFASYRFGRADRSTQNEIGSTLSVLVLTWPFVLIGIIVCAQFAGMIWLGHWRKQRLIEKEQNREIRD